MEQISRQFTSGEVSWTATPLSLYDRYGSMAYGIILKIIPEPELAQAVLIDVFASPQLKSHTAISSRAAGDVIRLARAKALAVRAKSINSAQAASFTEQNNTTETAKLVFDLSFCQGYTLEAIAEKMQLSHSNVLKYIYTYFKQIRLS